jgi:hypothetical protein
MFSYKWIIFTSYLNRILIEIIYNLVSVLFISLKDLNHLFFSDIRTLILINFFRKVVVDLIFNFLSINLILVFSVIYHQFLE